VTGLEVMAIRRGHRYSLGTGTGAWVGRYWLLPGWIVFVRRAR